MSSDSPNVDVGEHFDIANDSAGERDDARLESVAQEGKKSTRGDEGDFGCGLVLLEAKQARRVHLERVVALTKT